MDRRIRLATTLASAAFIVVAFTSCPNLFSDNNLKDKLKEDVAVATARVFTLTIESDANGISTPTGAQSVKEGIPFEISTNPFSTHAFSAWSQTGGAGTAVFADEKAASTTVTVTGGNASIKPVFVVKPKVLYATPMGNDIPKNSRVTVVFSKDIDASTVSSETITITENGVGDSLGGQYSVSGGVVSFAPDNLLGSYKTYVISVTTALLDADGIALIDSFNTAFKTGGKIDDTPPQLGDFTLTLSNGYPSGASPMHTDSRQVTLTIDPLDQLYDDSEIPYIHVFNDADATAETYDFASEISWLLSDADGEKTVTVTFEDQVGNVSDPVPHTIILDTTPPDGSIVIASGADFTASETVALTLSASDPVSGAAAGVGMTDGTMTLSNDDAFAGASAEAYATNRAGWTLSSGDGVKTVYALFADALGNTTTSAVSDTIYLDKIAPTGTINGGATVAVNDPNVTVSLSLSDGSGSGVATVRLVDSDVQLGADLWSSSIGESGDIVDSGTGTGTGTFTAAVSPAATFSFPLSSGDDLKDVKFDVTDAVGNVAQIAGQIRYDTTPPTLTGISISGTDGITNTTAVTVTINGAADANSGTITHVGLVNDDLAFASPTWLPYSSTIAWTLSDGDGGKTVYVKLRDEAGNVTTTAAEGTITLDTTAPSGTFVIAGNATYSAGLSVTVNSSVSGVTQMRFSNDNTTWPAGWVAYNDTYAWTLASGDGTKTVYGEFKDAGGNVTALTDTIVLDMTAPTGSFVILGTGDGTNAYTNTLNVSLSLSMSDSLSGLNRMNFSTDNGATWSGWETYSTTKTGITLSYSSGNVYTVLCKLVDKAGNVSGNFSDTIILDTTPPTVTSVAINGGAATTPSLQATVTIAASDTGAGLYQYRQYYNGSYGDYKTMTSTSVTVNVDWPFNTNAGNHYVYVSVKDKAGNVSSWMSDYITLEVPTPLYAMKGVYSGGYTYVYGTTVQAPTGTNTYYIYSTTDSAANPNVDASGLTYAGVASGSTYTYPNVFQSYAASPAGELRYFFVRAYNSTTGGYGPYSAAKVEGWSANVTIVYDANDSTDTALAQAIKARLETSLPAAYPSNITGTQPTWTAILIPETMVSSSFIAGTTSEAYYRYVIYGDPTIVTPGTIIYANTNQTRNLVSGTRGVVGMGYGGTRLIDTVNSYWTTWGLSGTQPANIGYLNSATFTDSTLFGYSYNLSNTVWTSPLTSTSMSGTDGSVQLSYTTMPLVTRYSVYRLAGAAITGGWLYEREPNNVNYFGVAHQGRFLHWGFGVLPDRPYTGGTFFVNLIARMDDY